MSSCNVDSVKAGEIATRFLGQYNSVRGVETTFLENDEWAVTVLVSSPKMGKIKVRVDAKSGRVLGWE